ncbi:MAG: helix-turn-helix domain-containing protein [Clostridia bacterium]|nr:helix-turn-helix domain-containing protein [Clostridia bacterium]
MDKSTVLNRVYSAQLPSRAKTVMFYLINRSNKEFTCFPAIPTIAKETALSERTVQRALKELCEGGFIAKTSRYRENGGQSSNLYTLLEQEDNKNTDARSEPHKNDVYQAAGEIKKNKIVECQKSMKIIDFSCFEEITHRDSCHPLGAIFVPP